MIKVLCEIVDFAFKGGTRNVITISANGEASWSTRKKGNLYYFSNHLLKEAIDFLIRNSYFLFGNLVTQQIIGIPMGSDPAPFFANLYLASHEIKWVLHQRKLGLINLRKINNIGRFIDDLESINDDNIFENNFNDIYPKELKLKKENNNNQSASFLDIQIDIEDGMFHTRLFDKRDNFGFDIVRMPFSCSNIPNKMFYGSIGAEFLRITRATSKLDDLIKSSKQLLSRMSNQKGKIQHMQRVVLKMIRRHETDFRKYETNPCDIVHQIGLNK